VETLKDILLILLPIILASIPGIWALRIQSKKDTAEKSKISAEVKKVSIDTDAVLQEIYTGILGDLKNQYTECKSLSIEMETQIKVLTLQLAKFKYILMKLLAQMEKHGLTPEDDLEIKELLK